MTLDNDVQLHISNLFCTSVFISFSALSTLINNKYCIVFGNESINKSFELN